MFLNVLSRVSTNVHVHLSAAHVKNNKKKCHPNFDRIEQNYNINEPMWDIFFKSEIYFLVHIRHFIKK